MSADKTSEPDMSLVKASHQLSAAAPEEKAPNMVIRQDPFSITLDASALFAIALLLIFGMHFVEHSALEMFIVFVPALLLIHNDYNNFLKLGPGGTDPTFSGYAHLAWYRLWIVRDPFSPPPRDPSQLPAAGILAERPLPYRPGPRPVVAGLAPQRQLTQAGCRKACEQLKQALARLTASQPHKFVTATSCLEKHGFALFARRPLNVGARGEVVHLHDADRSMHLNLHPDDIKEVLQKGWGQRHPMSWTGWVYTPVASTFVMLYAPRDNHDLRIILEIVEAAIWFTASERVNLTAPEEA